MAAATCSLGERDMQVYDLDLKDLTSADICSWRLRAAPHLDACEVGVFHHGDRIKAIRDSEHCQWLRLTDGTGWVKECHEGNSVWKVAQNVCMKASMPSPAIMSCVEKDVAKWTGTKSTSSSSGSQSIPQSDGMRDLMLRDLMPLPFAGQGHRLSSQCEWFTGKSCKLWPDEGREKDAEKQRWADMEDTEDSDSQSTVATLPSPSRAPTSLRERWADMEDTDDEEDVGSFGGDPRMRPGLTSQTSKDMTEILLAPDFEASTQASTPREQHAIRNPVRRKKNQALLARKNKTQLCQHLADKGSCPFGDDCWFAHSPLELQADASMNMIATSSPIRLDGQEEEADSVSGDIRKPRQRARNQALLKRKNKTQFCRYLQDTGCCPFEGKCWFAHDIQEVQT